MTTLQKALSLDKEGSRLLLLDQSLEADHFPAGFWNEARIGKLIEPLAKQVQLPVQSSLLFKQHYRPTVCAFAHQAAAFEDALTDLNRKLLEQTRSEFEDATRAEALRTLAALWKEVRDPLMPLVPQTTPFIVEALEEPGDVEAAAREMVAAVEG